jgi:chromosome segregation ATPase
MYLSRNIVENVPSLVSAGTEASSNSSNELTQKRQHLAALRKRYLQLLSENQQTLQDCQQKEQLISQMNSALFKYRVGVQVLDRYEVTPLNDSIGQLQQHANQLKALTAQAEGPLSLSLSICLSPPHPCVHRTSSGYPPLS